MPDEMPDEMVDEMIDEMVKSSSFFLDDTSKKASPGTDRKHNVNVNSIHRFFARKSFDQKRNFSVLWETLPTYSEFKQKSRYYLKIGNEKSGRS